LKSSDTTEDNEITAIKSVDKNHDIELKTLQGDNVDRIEAIKALKKKEGTDLTSE
jgi:NACalpha-BTF3-like transcription factor